MAKHICTNRFTGEGANGGCFIDIESSTRESFAILRVGWSCVIVYDGEIPITWLAEIIAIATDQKSIAKFLAQHNYAGGYALQCNPETKL